MFMVGSGELFRSSFPDTHNGNLKGKLHIGEGMVAIEVYHVTFDTGHCHYEGALVGAHPERMPT